MEIQESILQKWAVLIDCAKKYWIDSVSTGMLDEEFDRLELQAAQEDGFFVRDYVYQTYLKGTRSKNAYIEKIKKFKVNGSMYNAFLESEKELGVSLYYTLKYDGSSIAIYLDPKTGHPKRIVTVGNLNIDDYGVDQTWKLMRFMPQTFPTGIVAIQCEALVDTRSLPEGVDPQRARQKANGLINSVDRDADVLSMLTLRAYRYYTEDTPEGCAIRNSDYKSVLEKFPTVVSPIDGRIMFAPAQVWSLQDLARDPNFCETDITSTSTGTFTNDGWVLYNKQGICQRALKFSGAGQGELVKATIKSIQWNDQTPKGKDSWSANVIIDPPVVVKGCNIKKPSAGSVSKLVKKNITPGAEVSIIMANSTIPMVGEVYSPGNGDFMWPVCSCGYPLSDKDVYGSLLKCGNPMCTKRIERMRNYLSGISDLSDIDLNKFLVLDRFKWENTKIDIQTLLEYVQRYDETGYYEYLKSFLNTPLQIRNLDLVWKASYYVILEDKRLQGLPTVS